MAVTAYWYPRALETMAKGETDWVNDDIRLALCTSSYTYADSHDYFNDITNEVAGTGYVAGGAAINTTTVTYTEDQNATAWATGTAYSVGDVVRAVSANGHVFRCVVAGTSHATTEPVWDLTPGQDSPSDNGVIWTEAGRGYITLDGDDVSWANSTITARYGIVYNRTPATDATRPLLGFVDFGQDEATTNDTFQVTWASAGILRHFPGYGGT